MDFGVKISKVDLPPTFWLPLFPDRILTYLGQCFFLLCLQIKNDETKMPRKFGDKLSLIKVIKGRYLKALDAFANFSVLCQVGRFTYAFCYQFLMIFRCFGIFPLDRTCFCYLHNTRK